LGGLALRRGEATLAPRINQGDTLDDGWQINAAYAATVSLDPAGRGD
jgi:hypothetical protein